MKTHTLEIEMSFTDAVRALEEGKCIGIRPGTNMSYLELWRPHWKRAGWTLRWTGTDTDQTILTEQYLGTWKMVIVDQLQFAKIDTK